MELWEIATGEITVAQMPNPVTMQVMAEAQQQPSGEDGLLSPEELGELAKRMAEAKDPKDADCLQEEIVRGFYGGISYA